MSTEPTEVGVPVVVLPAPLTALPQVPRVAPVTVLPVVVPVQDLLLALVLLRGVLRGEDLFRVAAMSAVAVTHHHGVIPALKRNSVTVEYEVVHV